MAVVKQLSYKIKSSALKQSFPGLQFSSASPFLVTLG